MKLADKLSGRVAERARAFDCDDCRAAPGTPCIDLRNSRPLKHPHKGRWMKVTAPRNT